MKKSFTHTSTLLVILSFVFVIGVMIFPQTILSQDPGFTNTTGGGGLVEITNPFSGGETSLFALLKKVINDIVLPIGGVLAVLSFIYSGFLYVMAQGSEDKLKTAHKALLYTSIGTAVLLGSWVLANVICETIKQLGGPATCGSF